MSALITSRIRFWLALAFTCLAGAARADDDELFRAFADPPVSLRPFVRWWWNGGRVEEAELLRELDVLQGAGIGGVEINTVAMPGGASAGGQASWPARRWLGPEWCRAVKVAAEAARARGMTADLIIGSGWPFGGEHLNPSETAKRVRVVTRRVTGPALFQETVARLAGTEGVSPQVLSGRLVPAGGAFTTGQEIPGGDPVRVQVPPGPHVVAVVLLETGWSQVTLGAPGGQGPVLDHFDAASVRAYLDRMSAALAPVLGGALGARRGGPLRAAFVDSLELDGANWTGDLPAEFARRRGYALLPYLPFVLDPAESAAPVQRARQDFDRTLLALFEERFMQTTVRWAHEQGLLARVQAYGRETHPLEGSLAVDLPEGETWLWSAHDRVVPVPSVVNKYVSSAAHLAGRAPISFEAMTNTVPVFRETLEDFKLGLDLSLLGGVQQPILHGFNFSPRAVGFPGWVRFGSWLDERAPWWPHFHRFTDYAARLTAVLSRSESVASVALLCPRADEWASDGLANQPFPEVSRPWYHYHLWEALQAAGFGTDYVSEGILRGARLEGGRLRHGTRSYDSVVLMDVQTLEPETAEALARFSEAGGRVLLVGRRPDRAPGLKADDERVRRAMTRGHATLVLAPEPGGPLTAEEIRSVLPEHARRSLLQWALVNTGSLGMAPDVRVAAPRHDVSLLHQRAGARDVFFVTNTNRRDAAEFVARMPTGSDRPWRWDPETGGRAPLAGQDTPGTLALHLEPLQSTLVVYEPAAAQPPDTGASAPPRRGRDELPIRGPWQVTFEPVGGRPFRRRLTELSDLSLAVDKRLSDFGGTVRYQTRVTWKDAERTVLSLGPINGTSSVRLNGRSLGQRWYGPHLYDTAGALVKGRNVLEITVTTSLGNLMRAREQAAGVRQWAWWFPPIAAGLVGPVQLMKPAGGQ